MFKSVAFQKCADLPVTFHINKWILWLEDFLQGFCVQIKVYSFSVFLHDLILFSKSAASLSTSSGSFSFLSNQRHFKAYFLNQA